MMLFSFMNMKLRDAYNSLDEFCSDTGVSKDFIVSKLKDAGFEYNAEMNKFW